MCFRLVSNSAAAEMTLDIWSSGLCFLYTGITGNAPTHLDYGTQGFMHVMPNERVSSTITNSKTLPSKLGTPTHSGLWNIIHKRDSLLCENTQRRYQSYTDSSSASPFPDRSGCWRTGSEYKYHPSVWMKIHGVESSSLSLENNFNLTFYSV